MPPLLLRLLWRRLLWRRLLWRRLLWRRLLWRRLLLLQLQLLLQLLLTPDVLKGRQAADVLGFLPRDETDDKLLQAARYLLYLVYII